MTVKETIAKDLITAMKSGDKLKLATLRLATSAFTYAEKEKRGELNDAEMMDVLAREVKKRREASAEFAKAGRIELSDKEIAEAQVLLAYLPEQLTEDEIRAIVIAAVAETGASGMGDIGKVMGAVMPKTKGRADGKMVGDMVRAALA